jgi:hypothetical protein
VPLGRYPDSEHEAKQDKAQAFALARCRKMRELFSAFGSTVFFPLVSLVLPGLTAISSWYVLMMRSADFRELVRQNHSETAFVLMLLSIFVGTVIDDLGMRIESFWFDRQRDARTKGLHFEEWWAYLRTPFEIEPSGRRHLRNLVTRLKFELGVPVALAFAVPGVWLNSATHYGPAVLMSTGAACLVAYLLLEAAATHEALGLLRHELLREVEVTEFPPRRNVRAVNG